MATMIFADTHVLVWLMSGDSMLPEAGRNLLLGADRFAVSAVTAWEYADLQQRGRLPDSPPFEQLAEGLGFTVESFPRGAWRLAAALPPIHGDPVDRMVIAHTLIADGRLATVDANMRRYPVNLLW